MIIVVSHQKGGVGKSTIAWNLAVTLQKKYEVKLIDLDIQKTLTYANEIRKQQSNHKPLSIENISLVDDFKQYLKKDDSSKISIVDVGGFDSSMNRLAIATADLVIVPVSDKSFELLGIKTFEKVIIELNNLVEHTIKVKVILNNINPRKSKLDTLKEFITKSSHFELFETILRHRTDYDKSAGEGLSVIEYNNKSKASKEIKSLCSEIVKNLKTH